MKGSEPNLSYRNKETLLSTITMDPYDGSLNQNMPDLDGLNLLGVRHQGSQSPAGFQNRIPEDLQTNLKPKTPPKIQNITLNPEPQNPNTPPTPP